MATLNVFELTNQELRKDEKMQEKTSAKKTVKESVSKKASSKRPASKKIKPFAIPASKLKFESLSKFRSLLEDDDVDVVDTEVTADYTPDDDVVLVIDPDMDEVPEDVDAAEEAAEDLVGAHVCKCAICGANYVTDEELAEDMEVVDDTCPVCGEEGDQIVVGVITATDELSDEDKADIDDVDVEVETDEDGDEDIEDIDVEEEEDEDFEESVKRSRIRTMRRKAESVRRKPLARKTSVVRKPMSKMTESDTSFDEITFNRMLTTFAKENYSNVKFVKISKGSVRGNKLTLEGVVTTTKGSKRPIKFVCENFEMGKRMTLDFKEFGPFTESVKTSKPTFIVECVTMRGKITPVSLRYSYKAKNSIGMKEGKNLYSVTGKVLSESVRRRKK